ncbi:succinate dehydrogenase assembly factor 2, mitochondrial [Blastocladiella britannica]|nr:succinate dehydrogenase assembly factor 2, mitochondrial [Blastocladiella britannica]
MHPPTDDTYDPILFRPVQRPNESDDSKRRRLVWQSRKRGILECDLLLSTFAREHLASLTREQLDVYDALLEENDWDIYYWATKKKTVPAHVDTEVMAMIQIVAENHGRKILKMPELDEFGKLSGGGANK